MSKRIVCYLVLLANFSACSDDAAPKKGDVEDVGVDARVDAATDQNSSSDADAAADLDSATDQDSATDLDSIADEGRPDMGVDVDEPDMPVIDPSRELCADTVAVAATGLCNATPGTSGILLHVGEVLAHDIIYENGYVLVDGAGKITCTGCDCATAPAAATAAKISCSDAVLSPGLINTHDHVTFSAKGPLPDGERYDHRHDWRRGARGHDRLSTTQNSGGNDDHFVELRQMLTGTTSVAGSGGDSGFLRNLDRANGLEGLIGVDVDYDTFPLGDSNGTLLSTGCGYAGIAPVSSLNAGIYMPHVAEGVDAEARNEYLCLAGASGSNLIAANTSIVQGVGLNADDIADIAVRRAKLIWSPRSNIRLYGTTARIPLFHRFGVTVALGTDWSATGSATLLRELKCADSLNRDHYNGLLSDRELWEMVTINGAIAMGAENQIGSIRTGYVADLALFARAGRRGYRAVIDADTKQAALVLRGGQPLVGDANIIEALVPVAELAECEPLSICQQARRVCAKRDSGLTIAQIMSGPGPHYGPFFCGVPPGEPSCVPSRLGEFDGLVSGADSDGDGINNAVDICPLQFNPVRTLDTAGQADFDSDAIGDECDACPLVAGQAC